MTLFRDRAEAGRLLASQLAGYADQPSVIVLGIPRGGVVVAFEVAQALRLPLDAYVVRKLGVPGQEELAMGAVAHGGLYILHQDIVESLQIPERAIQAVLRKEEKELERREQLYRRGRPPLTVSGKTILLIDDGLATGSSMRLAIRMLRRHRAARIVVGVPVAPSDTCQQLMPTVDELVCVHQASVESFFAIGSWYEEFAPTSDEEVCASLERANLHPQAG